MARPWISLLLLSLVLVAIDARDEIEWIEPCPQDNVCVLFSRGTVVNHKGMQISHGTTGYLWEAKSQCLEGYYRHGFITGLWIQPISFRKWKFVVTGSQDNEITKLKFEFGSAAINFYRNETEAELYTEVRKNGEETPSSTHKETWHQFFKSKNDDTYDNQPWLYERYAFEVEFDDEKLINAFGGDVVKMIGPTENSEMNDPRFNELLHQLTSPLCDQSELRSFEFVNAVNGTIPMLKGKDKGVVDCPTNLWYRKPGGEWEPLYNMTCTNGAWQGIRELEVTEAPTEETTTAVGEVEDEDDDDLMQNKRKKRESTEQTEPEEEYDLTGADVVCGERPPPGGSVGMTGFQKGAMGVGIAFVVLAIVALIIGAVIFVLRRKRAAAGPNDTFRAGSDSKAQTPKGGSMSKKSDRNGSVVENGGMSPAGTPNTAK